MELDDDAARALLNGSYSSANGELLGLCSLEIYRAIHNSTGVVETHYILNNAFRDFNESGERIHWHGGKR